MKVPLRILIALAGILLAACGTADVGGGDGTPPPTETSTTVASTMPPSNTPTTTSGSPDPDRVSTTTIPAVTGEVPDEILDRILADAADRAEIDVSELRVVRDQAVEWPDGSLGCPEPGQFYTQAIVSGYWVEIEAPDETLDYRVSGEGNFKLCESGILPPSQGGFVTPTTPDSDS